MSGSVARTIAMSHGGGTKEMIRVPVEILYINPKFDKRGELGDIDSLAKNIAMDGFHSNEPILVKPIKDTGTFEVVDGRRRTRASLLAKTEYGWDGFVYAVPLDPKTSDQEIVFRTLNSNSDHRKAFEPVEEGMYYHMLKEELGVSEKDISEKVMKSVTYVRDRIAIATKFDPSIVVEVNKYIVDGVLTPTAAAVIAKEKDKSEQIKNWNLLKNAHAEKMKSKSSSLENNKTEKIKGKDVSNATKGHTNNISMKFFKENKEKLENIFKETGHEQYKFALSVLWSIENNKVFS
mgnify:CR=1 FL=1